MYRNCVYRFKNNNDEIIYLGKAKILKNRLNEKLGIHTTKHLSDAEYLEISIIEFIEFETENDMDFAERYYIQKYTPKYNKVLSTKNISLEFKELEGVKWKLFYKNEEKLKKYIEDFKEKELFEYSSALRVFPVKTNIKITDYILMFSLMKNGDIRRHQTFLLFKKNGELKKLQNYRGCENLEREHESYQNINFMDEILFLKTKIFSKVKIELKKILDKYKGIEWGLNYATNDFETTFSDFNSWNINLAKNKFKMKVTLSLKHDYCNYDKCITCNFYKDFKCTKGINYETFEVWVECI